MDIIIKPVAVVKNSRKISVDDNWSEIIPENYAYRRYTHSGFKFHWVANLIKDYWDFSAK